MLGFGRVWELFGWWFGRGEERRGEESGEMKEEKGR